MITQTTYTMRCAICGDPFTAHRSNARHCSPRCRQAASRRARATPQDAQDAPAATPVLTIMPTVVAATDGPDGLLAEVLAEGVGSTARAAWSQAVSIARTIEGGDVPAHALAALHRALQNTRAEVIAGIPKTEDRTNPLEDIRRRRELIDEVSDDVEAGVLSRDEADHVIAGIRRWRRSGEAAG